MSYDTTSLLESIERRASIPLSQSTFSEQEILDVATDVISETILPDILKTRQEFLTYWEDVVPIKRAQDNYSWVRIPERAIGQTIISLCEPEDDAEINPTLYWIESNKVYLNDDRTDAVRVRYSIRPGKLVEVSAVGAISSIDRGTGVIAVTARPTTFTSTVKSDQASAVKYDLVKRAAGFDLLGKDLSATMSNLNSTDITFVVTDIPSELEVGDYVCLADTTPVPQIPTEWFQYLAQHTASSILESLGDLEGAKKVESKLQYMRNNALSLVSPRIKKKSKAIKV